MSEEAPKITATEKTKKPRTEKQLANDKRLVEMSRQARERRKERMEGKVEEEEKKLDSNNLWYLIGACVVVVGGGILLYNNLSKREEVKEVIGLPAPEKKETNEEVVTCSPQKVKYFDESD